jgi:hypothetical protein
MGIRPQLRHQIRQLFLKPAAWLETGTAQAKLDGLDLEVWEGPRVVIRLKSTEKSKAVY